MKKKGEEKKKGIDFYFIFQANRDRLYVDGGCNHKVEMIEETKAASL